MSTIDEHAPRFASPQPGGEAEAGTLEQVQHRPIQPDEAYRSGVAERGMTQGQSLAWEVAQTVLLTVAIFLSVRIVVQNFRVEGGSMDPTLHTGQFLLIDKVSYARVDGTPLEHVLPGGNGRAGADYIFGGPGRGDIIVFRATTPPDKDFIKRVIGLPGETVRIDDGRVYVNGVLLNEPYVERRASYDMEARKVPSDSFFVLGDNRPNSQDSHLGAFGFVKAESIVGRAWLSYWPPGLWGIVQPAAYARN